LATVDLVVVSAISACALAGPEPGDPAEASAAAEACHDQPQAALAATPPGAGRP
jgi:hypothetical protein